MGNALEQLRKETRDDARLYGCIRELYEQGVPFEELLQAAGILDDYYIEKGREFVAARSDQPIPDDLTEEELAEVKKFIDYILSKRK